MKLDPESKEFIAWAQLQVTPEYKAFLFAKIATDLCTYYLDLPIAELRKKLKAKMIAGALEHGAPKKDQELIQKELEMEYLDLLGWTLMKEYDILANIKK